MDDWFFFYYKQYLFSQLEKLFIIIRTIHIINKGCFSFLWKLNCILLYSVKIFTNIVSTINISLFPPLMVNHLSLIPYFQIFPDNFYTKKIKRFHYKFHYKFSIPVITFLFLLIMFIFFCLIHFYLTQFFIFLSIY